MQWGGREANQSESPEGLDGFSISVIFQSLAVQSPGHHSVILKSALL